MVYYGALNHERDNIHDCSLWADPALRLERLPVMSFEDCVSVALWNSWLRGFAPRRPTIPEGAANLLRQAVDGGSCGPQRRAV